MESIIYALSDKLPRAKCRVIWETVVGIESHKLEGGRSRSWGDDPPYTADVSSTCENKWRVKMVNMQKKGGSVISEFVVKN